MQAGSCIGSGNTRATAFRLLLPTWQLGSNEAAEVRTLRAENPGVVILAHPECPPDVIAEADYAGHVGNTGDAVRWGEALGAALADATQRLRRIADAVIDLAQAEGLEAHAASVAARRA